MLYEAVAGLLAGAGLGVVNQSILVALPDRPDEVIAVREYPGSPPIHVKGSQKPALERPRVQVVARAGGFSVARARAHSAYDALSGFSGPVGGVHYSIRALQSPVPLGVDESGRNLWSVNFEVLKGPT